MRLLPNNFEYNKYGLHARLVNESDSEFILSLRTDSELGKFLNNTDSVLNNQLEWIREYKKREELGQDLYFIYYKDDEPIGVNRIYEINADSATTGSWVCKPNLPFELPILTVIMIREIFYDLLNLNNEYFDVRKENKKVQRFQKMFGAKEIKSNDLDIFYSLNKQDFTITKLNMLNRLNF